MDGATVWWKLQDPNFNPFLHESPVWRTDGRTDRQTDGQTDGIAIALCALSIYAVARKKLTTLTTIIIMALRRAVKISAAAIADIWPFAIFEDGGQPPSWIWSNRRWVHSIRRSENPPQNQTRSGSDDPLPRYGRSKFCKMRGRSVGRWRSSILHCSHTLLSATFGT